VITLADISYAYPDAEHFALEGVNLHVDDGEILGVVGASGAGKTTLAKIIAGFIPHVDGGELTGMVTVDGADVAGLKLTEAVAKVGLVIQNPFNQISGAKYTVRDELAFGLENLGVPREQMRDRVTTAGELLGIDHLFDRSPYDLSGGQQQLVAIASMVVLGTPVLVMDEPTSQLDPAGTRMVFDVLATLRAAGTTIVVLEHKIELLRQHCDRVAVVADETIAAVGPSRSVLADERMDQWGIGSTRYAQAYREAVHRGAVRPGAEAPVSLDEAAELFRAERAS